MKVIKLVNGDIPLTQGDAEFLEGDDAKRQIIRNALSIWQGEWFRDRTRGVRWLDILQKRYSRKFIESEIRRVLLTGGFDFIDTVLDPLIAVADRRATIDLTVISQGNAVSLSEEL